MHLPSLRRPPSLLITDDDAALRETLREVLTPSGLHTLLAADGHEALEIVSRQAVDLLLMDFHMPRLNGLETLRRIREQRALLPCIFMSAGMEPTELEAVQREQAFSVLTKPVSRHQVTSTVETALWQTYGWRR